MGPSTGLTLVVAVANATRAVWDGSAHSPRVVVWINEMTVMVSMTDLGELYARTRSLLAALGDSAESWEAAADYEEVLLLLDGIAPAARQPLVRLAVAEGTRGDLYLEARAALGLLRAAGVDGFEVGICATLLATRWGREQALAQ